MFRPQVCLLFVTVAGIALATQAGCGKSKPPPLKPEQFHGSWIEAPGEQPKSDRIAKRTRLSPKMRKLTINGDGTFTLELADPSGAVSEAGKNISGKWKLEEDTLLWEDVKNTLGGKYDEWAPEATSAVVETKDGQPQITVISKNGEGVIYKKL